MISSFVRNVNRTLKSTITLLALITPALIGEILGSLAKLRPAEKRPAEKGKQISLKIQFWANILFLLNFNKNRVFSTGYLKLDL